MVRLVKDLLVLSQLDFQQVGWHKDQYALDELITEVVAELKLKYKETARQITVSLPVEPVIAYIDRDKIKQVLLNIIHNAYKYTAEGGQITISLEQQREQAVMQVSDDGIGIPAADVERVFERFYRVDKNRSRAYGGTGLGLPIARELVAAHGGTISLSSELQRGTTVTVTLPAAGEGGGRRMRERLKSVVLCVLILTSMFLTTKLLFGQPYWETASPPAYKQVTFGELRPCRNKSDRCYVWEKMTSGCSCSLG